MSKWCLDFCPSFAADVLILQVAQYTTSYITLIAFNEDYYRRTRHPHSTPQSVITIVSSVLPPPEPSASHFLITSSYPEHTSPVNKTLHQ